MTFLAMANSGANPKDFNISHLEPTDENVESIMRMLNEREAHKGLKVKPAFVRQLLEEVHLLYSQLFDIDEKGQCALSDHERAFIEGLGAHGTQLIDTAIRTDLLRKDYPEAFENYPELAQRITQNQFIRDRVRGQADAQIGVVV